MSGYGGEYPSDLTEEQRALVEPLLAAVRVEPKDWRGERSTQVGKIVITVAHDATS